VQVYVYFVADERNGMDGIDWTDQAGGRQGLSWGTAFPFPGSRVQGLQNDYFKAKDLFSGLSKF
jgi:hypothetical protein